MDSTVPKVIGENLPVVVVAGLISNAKLKSKSKDDDKIMAKVMKKFMLNVLIAEAYRHNCLFNVREKSGVIITIYIMFLTCLIQTYFIIQDFSN